MGSPKNEAERKSDEGPQHKVNLQPFLMSRYPITQDQYQAIMGPTDGSSWESGGNSNVRVLRGGCWFNNSGLCRSAGRNCYNAENLNFNWGFRFISSSPEVSGFCSQDSSTFYFSPFSFFPFSSFESRFSGSKFFFKFRVVMVQAIDKKAKLPKFEVGWSSERNPTFSQWQ